MPGSEEEREEAPRQRGASNHVSSGTTGRWAEIPRHCAPSAPVSEPGFSLPLPFPLSVLLRVSRGSQRSSPKLCKHPLLPGTHPEICAVGRIPDYVVWVEGREGKKGVICKIASCLLGEGEVTNRYDLGVFACLQKL